MGGCEVGWKESAVEVVGDVCPELGGENERARFACDGGGVGERAE